jgi:hypothetical protein
VADLTPAQEAEMNRLVEDEHVPEVQALAIVTEVQLDNPIGADGKSTVKPVSEFLADLES